MPTNEGFVMTMKATDGTLVPLYPYTITAQVEDWNVGEVYGPYQLTLPATGWSNNQQTVSLEGIGPDNIPFCTKILTGTQQQMIAQDQAYSFLDPVKGVESLQNQVRFTCTSTSPTVDLQVQISWTI